MADVRPNIIVITTDQQRCDSLGCYGSDFTSTPNIDRLASEGVLMEQAYCANPVCTPARASIFSGLYLSRHGAWNVGLNVPEDVPLLSHMLAAEGYRTHYIGKAHFQAFGGTPEQSREQIGAGQSRFPEWRGPYYGFETVELSLGHTTFGIYGHYGHWLMEQVGRERWESFRRSSPLASPWFGGEAHDWDMPTALHSSVWTAERAVEFLEAHDGRKPFLLGIGFQDPHHAHCVPRDFTDRVSADAVPLPDYREGELDDKPPHFRDARAGRLESSPTRGDFWMAGQGPGADYRIVSERDARLGRAYYHTMVRLIDREMGRILDALDRRGLAEDTLIVFTTDHGELLGDHGLWMKGPFHYEELVRIPMILRGTRFFPGGRRAAGLFSQVDIVPTVLAALGVSARAGLDGVDAGPMLRGDAASVRSDALIECVDDPRKLRLKTLVTADRKLTWYAEAEYGELYDLRRDPREKVNLWNDPRYAADKARLLGRLLDLSQPLERRAPRFCYA